MKAHIAGAKLRLIESGMLTAGLMVYGFFGNISASIGRKTWPHNIGLEDALIAFFALLACVVLLPVLCKGSIRQRLIAISISLLPAWILWRDVGRFVHLLNYVK